MKKVVALMLCLIMILPCVSAMAKEGYTTLYAEDGRAVEFENSVVEAQLKVGWYREPFQRLYAEGKSKLFPKSQVAAQLTVGWYREPVQRLYANNGKSKLFPQSQVAAQLTVGWYTTPSIDMYSLDGRKIKVLRGYIDAHKKVGWYEEPMARVYATGNRSKIVPLDEVSKYQAVGWYPLHKFMFRASRQEISKQFGELSYWDYYPGTPNSGDVAQWIYRNDKKSKVWIEYINFDKHGKCVWVGLRIIDVFPYLRLYSDAEGNVSLETVKAVLGDNGIYGRQYRENRAVYGAFSSYNASPFYNVDDVMDYDYSQLVWDNVKNGKININDSCGFNILL